VIATRTYGAAVDGAYLALTTVRGEPVARLSLHSAFDRLDARDETIELDVRENGDTIEVARSSTAWERAGLTIVCADDHLELRAHVAGRGVLTDVHLLGGRAAAPGSTGFMPSATAAARLFTPNPGDPGKLALSAGESAAIGVSGDGLPGRGHWFFTPAPLFFALDDLGIGLVAPVEELRFVEVEYRGGDRAFHLVLSYDGHTRVDGELHAPAVFLRPGVADPYEGIRRHRDDLEPPARPAVEAPWWREPIFCGWGAQCHLASRRGTGGPDEATQANYDSFLAALAEHGVVPGTIVIDDKWQDAYGTNEPDLRKWPDLKRWIADRHRQGQRVLLWWKAWDPEGLDPALCIRAADGRAVAVDPTNPRTRDLLRESMQRLLSPGGLDADGLKVDFTARTPSGASLELHGDNWGIALLHELLSVVYAGAKEAKTDALVITQTPHPGFVDVADMIRLNDMLRIDDGTPYPAVVPQMVHRAGVAGAACPELLIDTDDWTIPDKETWREYAELKPALGVPSLYYATHLDLTGEALDDDDYALLARTWAEWRSR
jgi:hypothetical protein